MESARSSQDVGGPSVIEKVRDSFGKVREEKRRLYQMKCQKQMENGHEEGFSMDRVHVIQEANSYGYKRIMACELVWFHNLLTSDSNGSSEADITLVFAKEKRLLGTYQLYHGQIQHKIGASDKKNFVYFPIPHDDADTVFVVVEVKCQVLSGDGQVTRRSLHNNNTKEVVYHGVHVCNDLENTTSSVKKWLSVAGIPVFCKDDSMVSKLHLQFEKKDIWMRSYLMMTDFSQKTEKAEDDSMVPCVHVEFVMENRNADWDVVKDMMDIEDPSHEDEKSVEFVAYEYEPQSDGLSTIKTEVLCSVPPFFSPFFDTDNFETIEALVAELNDRHKQFVFRKVAADVVSVALSGTSDSYGLLPPGTLIPDRALAVPAVASIPITVGGQSFVRTHPHAERNLTEMKNKAIMQDESVPEDFRRFQIWWNNFVQEDREKNPDDKYDQPSRYLARLMLRCAREKGVELMQQKTNLTHFRGMLAFNHKDGAITDEDYNKCTDLLAKAV